jgi:hypothetical protein
MAERCLKAVKRTVDTTPTAETLPAMHGYGAVAKCHARLGNVGPHGVRARCKVLEKVQGNGMCGVVVR